MSQPDQTDGPMWDPDIAAMNLTDFEKEGLQVYRNYTLVFEKNANLHQLHACGVLMKARLWIVTTPSSTILCSVSMIGLPIYGIRRPSVGNLSSGPTILSLKPNCLRWRRSAPTQCLAHCRRRSVRRWGNVMKRRRRSCKKRNRQRLSAHWRRLRR